MKSYEDMPDMRDLGDPLDAAFANPKAGKKLKDGELLPGMGGTPRTSLEATFIPDADAALSRSLDDAFSNPNFGKKPTSQGLNAVPEGGTGLSEADLAKSIDDAFANPKAGKKIPDDQHLNAGIENAYGGAGDMDLTYRRNSLDDLDIKSSAGLISPKTLVIGMFILMAVLVGVSVAGQGSQTPNTIRMDN